MKRLLPGFLLLLIIFCPASGQDSTDRSFHLGQIPVNGLTLDKGWLFHAGDEMAWAQPDHPDDDWQPVNPTDELHHIPIVRESGIGWFRLNLEVDSLMQGRNLAFIVSGLGAMEIYLNGQLLFQFGTVSKDYKNEQTQYFNNKLLSLILDRQSKQVLAIRYSFHKRNLYLKFANKRPVVGIVLKEINKAFADHLKDNSFESTLRAIQVSFYLPLGFLLLFLFMSFQPRKEYLYSGIFCVAMFLAILLHIFALTEPVTVSRSNFLLLCTQVLYIAGAISFIHSIYLLNEKKKSLLYYLIVLYGITSISLYFISYDKSGLFNAFFFPIINLEFLRLSSLGLYRKRKGALILFLTSLVFALAIISYIIFLVRNDNKMAALLQSICFIMPGLGLSLFYASEFASTASAERQRTVEVEKLSKEMIDKEIEKQQILADQNVTLEKQVAERTAELSRSLKELKETEEQLIQREKMASLGELTAGIAHEIQNPLNFVNNFSEVNTELIDEMSEGLKTGKINEALNLANDVKQNNEKINFHGKRADSIVKAMLQHSRNSSGLKEPTDINNLADECLRLSFHGMRAKDKSFNAKTEITLDKDIGLVNVVSQDIGRVLLNLFTNSFYSVLQKQKTAGENFEPLVSVRTKKVPGAVQIMVRDNGKGIPQKVIDKIFQPFFTTKPTGEGTGLGLSMSYDIITKGHDGELKVDTKEGEYAEFTIILPV